MKIVRTIASECGNGLDCAKIDELADGSILVRGYRPADSEFLAELALPPDENVVVVPRSVFEAALRC